MKKLQPLKNDKNLTKINAGDIAKTAIDALEKGFDDGFDTEYVKMVGKEYAPVGKTLKNGIKAIGAATIAGAATAYILHKKKQSSKPIETIAKDKTNTELEK